MLSPVVAISSIFSYILGWICTIFYGLISFPLLPFRKKIPVSISCGFICFWSNVNAYFMRWICRLDFQVIGLHNVESLQENKEVYVIISNHQSAWETVTFMIIFKRVTYLLKRELLWVPFFGWGLAMLNPVAINRSMSSNAMRVLLKEGADRLRRGYIFVAFPEGTRQSANIIGDYNVGGVLLAQKAKKQVVPVVHNAANFWARRSPWRFPGKISVIVAAPIDATLYDTRQLTFAIENWSKKQLKLINEAKNISTIEILKVDLPEVKQKKIVKKK